MYETPGISVERLAAVREALRHIVTAPELGNAALSDPRQMSNLLTDLLPGASLEKTVLVAAADNRVAERIGSLIAAFVPADTAIRLAAESLAASTGLTAESCEWATHEIAVAIGVLPESHERPALATSAPAPLTAEPLGLGQTNPMAVSSSDATVVTPIPQLIVQPAAPPPPPPPPPLPLQPQPPPPMQAARSRKTARIWVAAALAVVVAAAAVVAVVLASGSTPRAKRHRVVALQSVHIYAVTSGPTAIALTGAHAWVSQTSPDVVAEYNLGNGTQAVTDSAGLQSPWDIAAGGGYVWVANGSDPGSVTKLNAITGKVVQVLGSSSGIENPTAVAIQASAVWVTNLGPSANGSFTGFGSVTELSANTGAELKTIPGSQAGITYPVSIAVSGPYVWIADGGYVGGLGGVTRIDTRNGSSWTKTAGPYGFERPASIAISGSHVWVLNTPYRGGVFVTEMNASDGSFVRKLSGSQYDFGRFVSGFAYRAEAIAAAGNRVWVANPAGGSDGHGSLTEISAQTGALVRVLSGSLYRFYEPTAVAVAGPQVWVVSFGPKNKPGWLTVLKSFR